MPNDDKSNGSSLVALTLKWIVGVTIPILVFIAGAVWSMNGELDEKETRLQVLEVRVDNIEKTVAATLQAAERISGDTNRMSKDQAAYQAVMSLRIEQVQKDMSTLRKYLDRLHESK